MNRWGTACNCASVRRTSRRLNTSWVRLSDRDRARNKRDGGQFSFHVFRLPFLLPNRLPLQSNTITRNEKRFSGAPFGIIGSEEHCRRRDACYSLKSCLIFRSASSVPSRPNRQRTRPTASRVGLARVLTNAMPVTRHLGEALSGAISDDRPIIGFPSSCFGFYLVGTSTGAPLSFTKNTTNFAGLVWLAFRPTT